MCGLSQVLTGVTLGSSVLSTVSQLKAEKQKAEANTNYRIATATSALSNYIQATKSLNNRLAEEREATGQQAEQIRIQNLQYKAEAQASAASSGITGNSLYNLYKGYSRATAQSNYTLSRSLYLKGLQSEEERLGYRNQLLSTVNIMSTYTPNYWGTIFSGLGNIAQLGSKKINRSML